jgi:hypothetical protein
MNPGYAVLEMDVPSSNIYARALAEAKQELLTVHHQIDTLAKRMEQLEALIANLSPLLPPEKSPTLNFPEQKLPVTAAVLPPQPIWKSILQAINGKGESFSVKDALQALERIGRPIESPNKFQIARAVLKKKTENFKQIAPGTFAVIKRNEKEVLSEEKTP